ncbi:MAG: hypothetical protein QNK05_08635 [Myxococcota bacterium]|nr:hypothetical protein [Myxococcota bacterium]
MEKKIDLEALLAAVGAEPSSVHQPAASEFGERLRAALEEAVGALREQELVDVAEDHLPILLAEVTEAGLDSRSPKQLMKRVVRTLIASEHVEEVYGTDEMLFDALRSFLDPE